jgi:hypothetical protein
VGEKQVDVLVQVRKQVGISLYLWDLATESEVAAIRGSTATGTPL